MIVLPDRLVSWGAWKIRCWSFDGTPLDGGDRDGVSQAKGLLALDVGFVSWGDDGRLIFWDRQGLPFPHGNHKAHVDQKHGFGRVGGVLKLDNVLLSWGETSIRFWTRCGRRLGSSHDVGSFSGMLALRDRLVGWGGYGFSLLDRRGRPLPGGRRCRNAHEVWVSGVVGLTDRLVSWGSDGALRFWDLDGEPLPGGDPKAHPGWERRHFGMDRGRYSELPNSWRSGSVLALRNSLISWSFDGALRFWDLKGKPLPGGDLNAHSDGLWGVVAWGDGIVSWGGDRVVRFWDGRGNPTLAPWVALEPIDFVKVINSEIWVSLLGRPFQLLPEGGRP
jgi:hypothetical protein